jgi:hypothetical protein
MYPDNAKNKKTMTLRMISIIFTSFLFQNIYLVSVYEELFRHPPQPLPSREGRFYYPLP